ncbi:DUF1569 domain-containing protein [Taibaiella lutea]|uniref:DUF1569 domain-containing protein n=1 Tax=Taibaiella lutea TaxID=2608001 RepID=A0A5M6CH28_9BACT|nr:DUF1569 domain-containing protein [Taibaiella lutea]KAA5532429.1 DUF1569 domain-containing protein [Taibaiella lutea]
MKNVFAPEVTQEIIDRIYKLTPDTQRQWGKMTVSQMLAHCSVTYEMIYENIHPKPKGFQKFLLRTFVKNIVISEKPYKPNNPTAPVFLIKEDKDFHKEQKRLTDYIQRTQQLGAAHFEQKESNSFGKLSSNQWNNMFYKHLDHHLNQFGV